MCVRGIQCGHECIWAFSPGLPISLRSILHFRSATIVMASSPNNVTPSSWKLLQPGPQGSTKFPYEEIHWNKPSFLFYFSRKKKKKSPGWMEWDDRRGTPRQVVMETQTPRTFQIFLGLSKESKTDTYIIARPKEIDPAHWNNRVETSARLWTFKRERCIGGDLL